MQKLSEYITLLEKSAFIYNGSDQSGAYDFSEKDGLLAARMEKDRHVRNWELLKEDLKTNVEFRFRDMTGFGQTFSNNGLIIYNRINAIVFSVSYSANLYGLRFAQINKDKRQQVYSYVPFNDKMAGYASEIRDKIGSSFLQFQYFPSEFADHKIGPIILDGEFYNELDLWACLFNTHIHGVI